MNTVLCMAYFSTKSISLQNSETFLKCLKVEKGNNVTFEMYNCDLYYSKMLCHDVFNGVIIF